MVDSQLRAKLGELGQGEVLGDRVFETISDAIVEGRLVPGERLSDKEISEALGISRTPVREALQHLSWVGLVDVLPNRFTRVTEVDEATIMSTLEHAGLQAGLALQLAMRRMDADTVAEAVALLDRAIAASDADDAPGLMRTARAFTTFLARQSGNPVFTIAMRGADLLITRNLRRTTVLLGGTEFRGECYRQMRAAMLSGDANGAELWFRRLHDADPYVLRTTPPPAR